MASYGYTGYASDHHAYKPVAVDAEGRRKPAVVSHTPTGRGEYYVTKTEIIEHVPYVSTGYKQTSGAPVRAEVIRDYDDHHVDQGKWNRPNSSSPEKWGNPSSPVRYHADHHDHQRPQQVEEFIIKKQTQASQQPSKFAPLSTAHWRETPNFSPPVKTGYGTHQGDLSSKEWQNKPNEGFGVPYKRDNYFDPTPKPSYGSWSKGQGANLGQPTSDIDTAMQYLTGAAKPLPKRNTYSAEAIDSREVQRRYGGLNVASRPRDIYDGTIDSRDAARKYGGTTV